MERPAVVLVGALASGMMLAGCSIKTDACTKTRIRAEDVRDLAAVSARLVTADGDPVPDRLVQLGIRVPAVPGNADALGERTAADGTVRFDLGAIAKADPTVGEYLPVMTRVHWYYDNPDAFDDLAKPNYCSSEKFVEVVR